MHSNLSPEPSVVTIQANGEPPLKKPKLHGRAFYENLGSPKLILAPMVDQSEFAWRMLSRSFFPPELRSSLLAYSPMLHSRLFVKESNYRASSFQPLKTAIPEPSEGNSPPNPDEWHLDGNPKFDRPLFVQFCSNEPDDFLGAARYIQRYCDAVDLNLGCPQGIAKRGNYGAFLQEDWEKIHALISALHKDLDIPVTAKFRAQETKEKTLEYAKMILSAGASIITVHGRQREQKGHNTGLADWSIIKYLRDNLPPETVIFANGNILQYQDIARCLEATGADGVMSAEGNLSDPSIFAPPPVGDDNPEYWRGVDGEGGWRVDAVFRRYMDIIHHSVLGVAPPPRAPLFDPRAPSSPQSTPSTASPGAETEPSEPPLKKQRRTDPPAKPKKQKRCHEPNLVAMRSHLFSLLRALVSEHHDIRNALARTQTADVDSYERALQMVEKAVRQGLVDYEASHAAARTNGAQPPPANADAPIDDSTESSRGAIERCDRPWWICQPYIRPLPHEAVEKGSLTLSKKEKKRLAEQGQVVANGAENGACDVQAPTEKIAVDEVVQPAVAATG
ncbi:FMN-linked oxidoreductase [Eremomyces bilateralis CBS 781.70]|uniref:tRNA-dihydrouridine(16/17) synthase [NAD(P)(+)] n=1 Tax=Eremomyces bilateralis CBS 781.70 TaxID=1392243 RepID=A0A6G1G0S0_9PEZI|nr:FMN-linked oxidoreductase [Eremomyces bilateralis CBS 781.70]KAF1811707.1 FMN-linked oxidoreductase [Eremomyces bilateralis CBS 781.70]